MLLAWNVASTTIEENPFADRKLLQKGMSLPVIWLYYNDSDVNSRNWLDFMGRSTRAINLPFLNLCYNTIVKKNAELFRVEVIGGLSDLAVRLGGWDKLPGPLQANIAPVGEAEKAWIRACVLAKWGGLWLDPASICVRGFGKMPSDKVVFFGTDNAETYSGPRGTEAPGLRCVWSPRPEHPLFVKWEAATRERIATAEGGKQFRGDEKWDARQLAGEFSGEIAYLPNYELSRKKDGRRIEVEDLLAAGQQGEMTFELSESSIYIPLAWEELARSRKFGWFLRMSEEQIMQSDLVVSHLFRTASV
jgi:hypothetical protein